MAKEIRIGELKQGNIIKVEFGNGDMLRGCFYGKVMLRANGWSGRGNNTEYSKRGNFLVYIEPSTKKPVLVDINEYKDNKKTSIKRLTGTRFPKEVSDYLRKYVKAVAKQQKHLHDEIKLRHKRETEDTNIKELEQLGQRLTYEVDGDSLPIEQRTLLAFKGFEEEVEGISSVAYVSRASYKDYGGHKRLEITVSHSNLRRVRDEDIGVTPDFEYDGSYHPYYTEGFDVNQSVSRLISVSKRDILKLIKDLNGIKGISVAGNEVFKPDTGDYSGRGSIDFAPELYLDGDIKTEDLVNAKQLIVNFLKRIR